jgi:hypothetical protein
MPVKRCDECVWLVERGMAWCRNSMEGSAVPCHHRHVRGTCVCPCFKGAQAPLFQHLMQLTAVALGPVVECAPHATDSQPLRGPQTSGKRPATYAHEDHL